MSRAPARALAVSATLAGLWWVTGSASAQPEPVEPPPAGEQGPPSSDPRTADVPTADGPAADAQTKAEALFLRGKTLLEEGNFKGACPLLAESLKLDFGLGTLLYLSDCQEGLGQTASAWAGFKDAEALARTKGQSEREETARARAQALQAKLALLRVDVAPENKGIGLALKRNGVSIAEDTWGQSVPVDPGPQTLEASAPGHVTWTSSIDVAPGPGQFVTTVPRLDRTPTTEKPSDSPSGLLIGPIKIAGLSVAGAGLITLAVGTAYGVSAIDTYDDALQTCDQGNVQACTFAGVALQRDASRSALISSVTLGVGAAAVVGGALMFFLAPPDAPAPQVGVSIQPGGAFFSLGGAL